MYKQLQTKFLALLAIMLMGGSYAWAETGTLNFGNGEGEVKINAATVTGSDELGNTWTITTVGTTSFTANAAYYQVGSSSKPATSITFTTTLPNNVNVTSLSAKFGGFSNTAGTVTLKVGDTTVGTGSLNGTNDVTVESTSEELGNVLTITLTDIAKGVKCYYVSYTYESAEPHTVTLSDDNTTLTETSGGAGVTLPTRNALGNYTFAGWSVTNVPTETTEAPTIVTAGTYHPTADVTLYPVYTRSEGSSTTNTESVTISEYASTNSWEDASQYTTVDIDDNVTATASGGGNTGKYYTNGYDWRFYQNEQAKVIIALTPNGTLNSVKFDFTVSKTGTLNYGGNVVESGTAVNVSGNTAEFTVGNSGTATNGQVRITAIEVNYTIGNETKYYWSNPCETVSISSAGYATYVAADNVSFPDGVTAYIVSDVTASSIKLTEVLAVAKDVPVVVKATEGTYDLEVVTAGDCDDVTDNKLLVSDGTVSDNILVLANKSNGVGFYTWAGGNLPAGKVYLENPNSPNSSREFFGFDEGVATSISTIDNGQLTMDNAYNLQGQKVGSEYKGIVIVNGKKVIVK